MEHATPKEGTSPAHSLSHLQKIKNSQRSHFDKLDLSNVPVDIIDKVFPKDPSRAPCTSLCDVSLHSEADSSCLLCFSRWIQ